MPAQPASVRATAVPTPTAKIDELCVNTIRTLAMDAVQKANSGHAGTPMGFAPVAYTLWQRFLRYDPADPLWPNRDRFVLSAGHACLLLYSLLHLAGVRRLVDGRVTAEPSVSLDDLKSFRQIDSVTPGHPEYGHTTGVEATTGPLGQGCGDSVGMAIAARWKAQRYNKPKLKLFDYRVYVVCSDGDLMEGVASEAASLAGHLGLSNLCWLYDSNKVTIEGHTGLAFSEDVAAQFRAYHWNVIEVADANDEAGVAAALETFQRSNDRPTLIVVKSIIGYGAPHKQNTAKAHSDALGEDEVRLAKKSYGWPEEAKFLVPDGVYEHFRAGIGKRGPAERERWQEMLKAYGKEDPKAAREIELQLARELPANWDADLPEFPADEKGMATREASGKVLNAIAKTVPWLIGGSADLAPSTKTTLEGDGEIEAGEPGGRTLHFGVREHAMGAIVNGLGLSDLRAFGSTFLVFSDYMRPPIRLAALMHLPIFHVFTHDSIGVGEDGPTHQPIEQLVSLRAIPDLLVLRPADANEVREAYRLIMTRTREPVCLALSRQPLPTFDRKRYAPAAGLARGAYVMADPPRGDPQVILMASGSELQLCVKAQEELARQNIGARVVSMPSWELFEQQDQKYRDEVLPPRISARIAVEAGATIGWDRYTGSSGMIVGMHRFGASAPLKDLLKKFGFTSEHVVEAAKAQITNNR